MEGYGPLFASACNVQHACVHLYITTYITTYVCVLCFFNSRHRVYI